MFFPHFPSSVYFLKQPDWFPTLEKLIQLQETFVSGKTNKKKKQALRIFAELEKLSKKLKIDRDMGCLNTVVNTELVRLSPRQSP